MVQATTAENDRSSKINPPTVHSGVALHTKACHTPTMQTTLINKNVMLPVRTSIRLEPLFWTALHDIAAAGGKTIHAVVQDINAGRSEGTLTSAVRVAVLEWYRLAARGTE